MHEASLINALIEKIQTIATDTNAQKITKVSVWLGALSHMSEAHFKEHFDHASKGTIAENAPLEIELSEDITDTNAQDLVLKTVEIE